MKHLLFIDFETFYSSKEGYDLRKLSIVQYVRDARFKAFGFSWCDEKSVPTWIPAEKAQSWFDSITADEWKDIAVVGHNIKFDGFILKERYGVVPGQLIDTKGMSKAVLGKSVKGHALANLAEYYKLSRKTIENLENTNGKRDLTAEEMSNLATYCNHDVELCRDIYIELAKEFPENQFPVLHRTVEMFVDPKMRLNVALLEQTSKDEAERRAKIFDEIGIPKSEFASNVKFPRLLESKGFDVPMKYSPKKKDAEGNPLKIPALALGDPEFLEMLENDENPELQALCEARRAAKSTLIETRSAKLAAIGKTGLWPFDVEFSGADQTHRFSGGKGAGGNPQNFTACRDKKKHRAGHVCPGRLRTSVEAPDGYQLVVGDFSNIELRIVAYLSRDPGLVQSIEQGTDIYCDFASVFYGRKITKADELERKFGKTAILGLGYGMGWKKFKRTVRLICGITITDEEAKKAVDLYRTRYSGVKALWDALDNTIQVMATPGGNRKFTGLPVTFGFQCIVLPSGLKIRYPNLRSVPSKDFKGQMEWVYDAWNKGHVETRKLYGGKVLENISQAIAGEFCKEAMMKMRIVVGLVHDEIHALCKRGLGLVTAQQMKRVMSVAPSWFPQIKLDAEVHVGTNWGDAK